jgi:FAD/FMN-containing dehydrogenase
MVLAGLGQCALIVRARLRLVPAPSQLVHQTLIYDDLDSYLSDAKRLLLDGRFDHQSLLVQQANSSWSFRMGVGKFYSPPKEPDLSRLEAGLRFSSKLEPTRDSYWDYVHGEAIDTAVTTAARSQRRDGALVMFVPSSAAKDFLTQILATLSKSAFGLTSFDFPPLNIHRHTRPLLKLPDEDVAFSFWLYPRSVPVHDSAAYAEMMRINGALLERMRTVGGKAYPPFAPYSLPAEWEDHYGPETWQRLSDAKKKFDPNNVLTPGPGVFAEPSRR